MSIPATSETGLAWPLAWQHLAACRGLPLELFISPGDADDEEWEPPAEVKRVCDPCPVRPECLVWACATDAYGYWASTSRHQRRQLKRVRRRLACPACTQDTTAVAGDVQVCLACGLSWRVQATA